MLALQRNRLAGALEKTPVEVAVKRKQVRAERAPDFDGCWSFLVERISIRF